jgi:hypothetical protein
MEIDEAVAYFRSAVKLSRELGLRSSGAISNWRIRNGGKVPELYARKLHDMTRGKLRFDPKAYGLQS